MVKFLRIGKGHF